MAFMEELVCKYYRSVDKGNFKEALSIFSNDAIYTRCEKMFRGKKRITRFYEHDRQVTGKHRVKYLARSRRILVIKGLFKGQNSKGKVLDVKFVDIFHFNQRKLVKLRETFIAAEFEKIC